jgi:hypothetical protein
MASYNGRRIFRTTPWLVGAVIVADLLFATAAWVTYRRQGMSTITMLSSGLAVFGLLGIVEVLTARIILADDALEVTKFWVRRSYARDAIRRATFEKGCPVALELSDGHWAKLPDLGHNSQSVTNSIRAWLKAP